MLTPQELRLRALLRILAAVFAAAVLAYLLPALGLFGDTLQRFYHELPFVTNSVVKIGTLALLAFFAAADVRRFRLLTVLVIVGHAISELAMAAVLAWGDTARVVELPALLGGTGPIRRVIIGAMVMDGVILALLGAFHLAAERSRYGLRYFSPTQFRCLSALAEVVVAGEGEVIDAETVARNADRYLGGFQAQSKWLSKVVLTGIQVYPLLTLKAPFSYMRAEDRLAFLKRRFYQDVTLRLVPGFWRGLVQAAIRMAKQLCYVGYYGDARTFESVGYVPFSRRADRDDRIAASPVVPSKPVRVTAPSQVDGEVLLGDVVIIGSGAAASVMAHALVRQGREVLMLERGGYEEPGRFTEDEVEMLSRLYRDGAFQLSRDFRFQVLQGSCVGGTTVVNNAVCFRIPDGVLERWNDGLKAGLDRGQLTASFEEVERLVRVRQQTRNLNPGASVFGEGVRRLGLDRPPHAYREVSANIDGCLGCGYCNIGCAYGKKLSMLDVVLPDAQELVGHEALRIVAGCEALRLRGRGREITGVVCELADGRVVEVRGNTFVVAAGAISSSLLLLRSSVGGKNVGRRVSFNVGSPVTARFAERQDAYDGLQISHYLQLSPDRGYVVETWFNPPLAQALTMPGWFEDHFRNMRDYARMSAVGVLVGTEANGVVRRAGLFGREIDYAPTPGDFRKILEAVGVAGEIFFAGGAEAVMPGTFAYREYRTLEALRRLPEDVRDATDLTLGTGHPMGGNCLSADPEIGVVDPQFRVYGYENLFVCDASVFPTSLGVNPQLTVMALARYAADFVGGAPARAAVPEVAAHQPA